MKTAIVGLMVVLVLFFSVSVSAIEPPEHRPTACTHIPAGEMSFDLEDGYCEGGVQYTRAYFLDGNGDPIGSIYINCVEYQSSCS